MEIIIHRVNTIKKLKSISNNFGTEIDIRSSSSKLILSHDPFAKGDSLENYFPLQHLKELHQLRIYLSYLKY